MLYLQCVHPASMQWAENLPPNKESSNNSYNIISKYKSKKGEIATRIYLLNYWIDVQTFDAINDSKEHY